ncbi:cytochrome C [Oleiphilus sp. HI0009]|nr:MULTISPECIES: c-type cytochrome [unclassified Oleiphilus]KZX75719.1 cytochrome C [Oleiphilus sp. HI0009]MCH2160112.1 cytochrome c4 [Oleiphilaceae bacterium]KZX86017.1 cytochrome C [Oleiphilus sp. HI0009]KZY65635.1 cytochrome C [Oleiphilus sp. HI0066]KZY74064.1 cytochrome C [Oleiphilus sp. HI0067]
MNKLFKGLVVALGLSSSAFVSAEVVGDVQAGKDKSAVCAACHGADGNSAAGNFPKLAGQGERYLLKQMYDQKEGRRVIVEMTGLLDGFSDQDMADVAAYFAAQTTTVGQADPELVEEGRALYRAGNPATKMAACIACHGPSGKGVEAAGFPALSGQHADYTIAQMKKWRSGERANDGDARVMRSIAARMNDREIEAVASYISGLSE